MKFYGVKPVAFFMAFLAFPFSFTSYAEDEKMTPVYEDFNENDVNGAVVVDIPESATADVKITFDSPEVTGEPYYIESVKSGSYKFELEGADDDYRHYNVEIIVTGGDYNISESFKYEIENIPDVDNNPDSYATYLYQYMIDDEYSKLDYETDVLDLGEEGMETKVNLHINNVIRGDVDCNEIVNASDASRVLAEYSRLSVGEDAQLSPKQTVQADVNKDGIVNAVDASKILAYYSINSTGGNADWDNL